MQNVFLVIPFIAIKNKINKQIAIITRKPSWILGHIYFQIMKYYRPYRSSKRRTTEEIEEAVLLATEQLVKEKGFNNVAITEIMRLAAVQPHVMYRHFTNIEDIYDKFLRRYDYWLHDIVEYKLDENDPVTSAKKTLTELIKSLYDNPIMQEILIWEVFENNKLTCRNALNREINSLPLLDFFRNNLPPVVNINALTSVLIAGIYYLILRRDRSSFCGIDFNSDNGKNLLIEFINEILDYLFEIKSEEDEIVKVAKCLLEEGVDEEIIIKSTKLSKKALTKLKQTYNLK